MQDEATLWKIKTRVTLEVDVIVDAPTREEAAQCLVDGSHIVWAGEAMEHARDEGIIIDMEEQALPRKVSMPKVDSNCRAAQADQFKPPAEPVEVKCLHCGEVYSSDKITYYRKRGMRNYDSRTRRMTAVALWFCPTIGCDGAGFGFDIHPTK